MGFLSPRYIVATIREDGENYPLVHIEYWDNTLCYAAGMPTTKRHLIDSTWHWFKPFAKLSAMIQQNKNSSYIHTIDIIDNTEE